MGYDIFVGKNAANNDVLTFQYAKKNDIWLHARNSAGSHVVIRNKAEGIVPKPVLLVAAGIAAYYSKEKGSGMVAVAYTYKKFVRKPKGAAPGEVVMEKETVIDASPSIPQAE
jgi:predicted ribosome quality control (RQC) complex YloA/Tae2 family protein